MIKKIINNKDLIFGFIIGMLISAIGVYATTYIGAAADLTYNNTLLSGNWLTSTNVQDALDELYKQKMCPIGRTCTNITPGMYVSYTPTSTSYTTDTTYTGYTSTQTINPSELNLWRVLRVNADGSVDIISVYASSVNVYFKGETGYRNAVGYLNILASQYKNENYTSGSRYFGYNGQTEFITEADAPSATYFSDPPPWTCSTGDTGCNTIESKGGGDTLYQTDYNLALNISAIKNVYKAGTTQRSDYWIASRLYQYSSSYTRYYAIRQIYTNNLGSTYVRIYNISRWSDEAISRNLRPIVTLKSGLKYSGSGTEQNPLMFY